MGARNFRDPIAWLKALVLEDAVSAVTEHWPREQLFILTSQAQRAAVSVPSNKAAGQGRGNRADLLRFLAIAHGSLCELETQLVWAGRRRSLDQPTLAALLERSAEAGRLLHGPMRGLRFPDPK